MSISKKLDEAIAALSSSSITEEEMASEVSIEDQLPILANKIAIVVVDSLQDASPEADLDPKDVMDQAQQVLKLLGTTKNSVMDKAIRVVLRKGDAAARGLKRDL